MHKLTFKSAGFGRMIDWMKQRERIVQYGGGTTSDYGLWLVKDEGIYLMAPTKERDLDGNDRCHVIYARGYSPKASNLWEKTREVSRDDFAEFIPLTPAQMIRVAQTGNLEIGILETELELTA